MRRREKFTANRVLANASASASARVDLRSQTCYLKKGVKKNVGKTTLNPEGLTPPSVSHSLVAISNPGRLVFVSGQTASDPQGNVVGPGDIRAQTRYVLEKMRRSVEAAGGSFDDIVSMNVFVTDARYFGAVNEVRREVIAANFPASTMAQVTAFGRPEMLVEMNAIAVIPEGKR